MKHKVIRNSTLIIALSLGVTTGVSASGGGAIVKSDPSKHFDAKGKMPSKYTVDLQKGLRESLPFDDKRDLEEAKKGFIASPPYK